MDGKYVVKSIEERLRGWRELDRLADEAEARVADMGQGASDPRARDLLLQAKQLRESADREFAAILRAVKGHELHAAADSDRDKADDSDGEASRRA